MKKGIVLLSSLLFLLLSIILFNPAVIVTDAGWGSSYGDSGGASSWGGSSGYDWNYHDYTPSHRSRSDNSSGSKGADFFSISFLAVILVAVILVCFLFPKRSLFSKQKRESVGDCDSEIQKYFPNLTEGELIKLLYHKFLDVQKAWMEFDYQALKKLCSDELYQSYYSDLEVLKASHEQNIMSGFQMLSANIEEIKEENDYILVHMYLDACFYDYIIDSSTKEVTKGSRLGKLHNRYQLEFIVSKNKDDIICPNCGAKISKSKENVCPYCDSPISLVSSEFVLNQKNNI